MTVATHVDAPAPPAPLVRDVEHGEGRHGTPFPRRRYLRWNPAREGVQGRHPAGAPRTGQDVEPGAPYRVRHRRTAQRARHRHRPVRQHPLHPAPRAPAPPDLVQGETGERVAGKRLGAQLPGLPGSGWYASSSSSVPWRLTNPGVRIPGHRRTRARGYPSANTPALPCPRPAHPRRRARAPGVGVNRQHGALSWRRAASARDARCRPRSPWRRCARPRGRRPGRSPGPRARPGARTSSRAAAGTRPALRMRSMISSRLERCLALTEETTFSSSMIEPRSSAP